MARRSSDAERRTSAESASPDRPRATRRRATATKKRPTWKRILLWLIGLGLAAVIAGCAVFAIAYARTDIPNPNEFAESQSSIVYYADGKTEMARFTGGTNRESVPLADVPDHVQKAMLSAEDRSFYENDGISVTGTARAAWTNLTSGSTQGGSTITQQYVKNYYLTSEQSYKRKFKELMISVKIDRELPKDQILENYLNTIYYGRGAYGTQTASQAYFGKDVSDLDVSEGVFLAAVTNAPSLLDPNYAEGNQERAQERFAYILDGMVAQGWLSEADADAAKFPDILEPQTPDGLAGPTGYLVDTVRKELVNDLGVTADDIDRGGLRITSTIIPKHQDAAEEAVATKMPDSAEEDRLKVGLISIEPGTGAITAMYGGADYQKSQFNVTTDAVQQAGSLFKVFTLIAALEGDVSTYRTYQGYSPQTFDNPGSDPVRVQNFRNEQFGRIDLRTATANSVNTVFWQLNQDIGPANTTRVARELGIPKDTKDLLDVPSNVLGVASPKQVEMTNAFAAIAAEGELAEAHIVASFDSTNGTYDYTADSKPKNVIKPDIAADVIDAMKRVITEGSGTGAGDLGRPAAGKSGTSENNKSAWFDGFTPQLAASVLMYRGDGTEEMQDVGGLSQITGGSIPVEIWGEFMRLAQDGDEVIDFPPRAGVNDDIRRQAPVSPTPATPTPAPTTEAPTTPTPAPTTEVPTPVEETTPTPTKTDEPTKTDPVTPTQDVQPTQPEAPTKPGQPTKPAQPAPDAKPTPEPAQPDPAAKPEPAPKPNPAAKPEPAPKPGNNGNQGNSGANDGGQDANPDDGG